MAKESIFKDAIIRIMRDNNGHASVKLLSRKLPEYIDMSRIKGKTPLATMRRELQRGHFIRIGFGVWALNDARLPSAPTPKTQKEEKERKHADIQGMLLEIGNNRDECADTYTPDRKGIFDQMYLGSIATIDEIPHFTYDHIIKTVRYADVIWFSERKFPHSVFEVEHSTNFVNALTKFCDLQDFNARFCCVAESSREDKFEREVNRPAFKAIKDRCEFITYESVEHDYNIALQKTRI